ncbi:hypothetical protein [Streptacidiphilus carbonis]|uniref:hypothetical protein n=1 Tax=Streptacidiphilus carbonis TaxID=105422 RepID=UPI0005A71355|nr:hypothetical protein [Streptacidiphilus carbonis]
MNPVDSETKKDLRAAAHTARELGPEYESEVMDGFLRRLDERLEAQIAVRVRRELESNPEIRRPARKQGGGHSNAFQYVSLALGVPLSAIGASLGHLPGLAIAWAGIVGLNFIQLRGQRNAEDRPRTRRDEWD